MDKRNFRPLNYLLYLTCPTRHLQTILEEFTDRVEAAKNGSCILLYGNTTKVKEGFILINWATPIPVRLIEHLQTDEDILDFVLYDCSQPRTI